MSHKVPEVDTFIEIGPLREILTQYRQPKHLVNGKQRAKSTKPNERIAHFSPNKNDTQKLKRFMHFVLVFFSAKI